VLQVFVVDRLGPSFVAHTGGTTADVYADSSPTTPIIYMILPGVDVLASLERFARLNGFVLGDKLHAISLGQGQGASAGAAIQRGTREGHWVCLP
jgi:dynein heavy chain, axonemal